MCLSVFIRVYPEGGFIWFRERITIDPSDMGRICRPGRCLEDVMRELRSECPRGEDGSCPQCRPGQYPEWVEEDPSCQARLVPRESNDGGIDHSQAPPAADPSPM